MYSSVTFEMYLSELDSFYPETAQCGFKLLKHHVLSFLTGWNSSDVIGVLIGQMKSLFNQQACLTGWHCVKLCLLCYMEKVPVTTHPALWAVANPFCFSLSRFWKSCLQIAGIDLLN